MRCPYGHPTGPARESSVFFISYGTHKEPVRDPQGCRTPPLRTRKGIKTTRIGKYPAWASYVWPYGASTGPLGSPHRLFTGCVPSLNLYGARKLIMHALKLYRPRIGRQNSYGAAQGPCGTREWTYDFCSKQPGARECDVTEALVKNWWSYINAL